MEKMGKGVREGKHNLFPNLNLIFIDFLELTFINVSCLIFNRPMGKSKFIFICVKAVDNIEAPDLDKKSHDLIISNNKN